MRALGRIILVFSILLSVSTIASADTLGTYYITDYNGSQVYMVNGQTVSSFTAQPNETPIAVSGGTIRLESAFLLPGHSYDLSGNKLGNTAGAGLPGMKIFDATTDGTNNYFIFGNNKTVYKTDLDYGNPTALFTGRPGQFITYDPTNNSLWLSGGWTPSWAPLTTISDYSLDGTLLSSFDTGLSNNALAFDPADSSLWVANADPTNRYQLDLAQYSRTGTVLSTMTVTLPSRLSGPFGGEFGEQGYVPPISGSVPEPTSFLLLGSGILGLGAAKRRARS